MTKKQQKAAEIETAKDKLRGWIKPGQTVYTILDRVSSSGMTRHIRIVLPYTREDGTIDHLHPNHAVGVVLGYRQAKRGDGLVVGGCGMDMGFHLVYSLSRSLFPAGFGCIGQGCPSNDHSNGDRDYTPHYDGTPRNAEEVGKVLTPHRHYHSDGGYALRHRWL